MILFVVFYLRHLERKQSRSGREALKWVNFFETEVLSENSSELNIQKYVFKRLRDIDEMVVFLNVMNEYLNNKNPQIIRSINQFTRQLYPNWLKLARHYRKQSNLQMAYFAYATNQLPFKSVVKETHELEVIMLALTQSKSIYSKFQAFNALYSLGQIDSVVQAILLQPQTKGPKLHDKLITDGLLTFNGDSQKLIKSLYDQIDNLDSPYQTSLIDYARLEGRDILGSKLISILKDRSRHTDVICSTLRYYQRYPSDLAYPLILSWANETMTSDWECVAVATTALSSYPSEETTDLLIQNIHSREWYVRRNAAQAIQKTNINPQKLETILSGDDQYAKEQLAYFTTKGENHGYSTTVSHS
ncbi:hypothetical protein ACF3NG_09675 [Aerococcaceae bacterium WGS1372]